MWPRRFWIGVSGPCCPILQTYWEVRDSLADVIHFDLLQIGNRYLSILGLPNVKGTAANVVVEIKDLFIVDFKEGKIDLGILVLALFNFLQNHLKCSGEYTPWGPHQISFKVVATIQMRVVTDDAVGLTCSCLTTTLAMKLLCEDCVVNPLHERIDRVLDELEHIGLRWLAGQNVAESHVR